MTTEYQSRVIDALLTMYEQKAAAYEFIHWSPDEAKEALTAGIAWVLSRSKLPHGAAPANDALDAVSWARVAPGQIAPEARRQAESIVAEKTLPIAEQSSARECREGGAEARMSHMTSDELADLADRLEQFAARERLLSQRHHLAVAKRLAGELRDMAHVRLGFVPDPTA